MASSPENIPEKLPRISEHHIVLPELPSPWTLTLFDDDVHTFDDVILQLIKALRCDVSTAESLTMAVHNEGSTIVFEGDFNECFRINLVLTEIQLITEIRG